MEILKHLDFKKTVAQFLIISAVSMVFAYGSAYMIAYYIDKGIQSSTEIFTELNDCEYFKEIKPLRFERCEYINTKITEDEGLKKERNYLIANTKKSIDFFDFKFKSFLIYNAEINQLQYKYLFNKVYSKSMYNLEYTAKKESEGVEMPVTTRTGDTPEIIEERRVENMKMLVSLDENRVDFDEAFNILLAKELLFFNSAICLLIYKFIIFSLLFIFRKKEKKEKFEKVLKIDTLSSALLFSITISALI